MIQQILTWKYAIAVGTAVILFILIRIAAIRYNRESRTREFSPEYFREPTTNTLTIIGLLIPVLVGLSAYLFLNEPGGDYSLLWSSITVFIISLFLSIWFSFSVLQKANIANTIKLKFPDDLRFIVSFGLMYLSLIIGLLYLVLFFLFDFPFNIQKNEILVDNSAVVLISRPMLNINDEKSDVRSAWGVPQNTEQTKNIWVYYGNDISYLLEFDDNDKLVRLIMERRE